MVLVGQLFSFHSSLTSVLAEVCIFLFSTGGVEKVKNGCCKNTDQTQNVPESVCDNKYYINYQQNDIDGKKKAFSCT